MFLPASSSLPLLPPPFTAVLPTHYPASPTYTHDQFSTTQPSQRRPNPHLSPSASLRNPNSLQNLLLDESVISLRKSSISTYGYSWLRPAGVAKTMLGRREEEAEREELERQMREQEEMELEMERGEEMARQARLREQQQQGDGEEVGQRDLDEDIPDADERQARHEHEDADLDDDIPEAEADDTFNHEETDIEGETGITDEVEHTNLADDDNPVAHLAPTTLPPPSNRTAPNPNTTQLRNQESQAAHQAFLLRRSQDQAEQEALANTMLDEDEQALADRDLDADLPNEDENGIEARDLDDDVPEAEDDIGADQGEWQHTDTELEEDESGMMLMEDEGDISMDMSVVDGARRSLSGNAAAARNSMLATPAGEASPMLHTPATSNPGSASRSWLSRRSLSGRDRPGNLFAGIMGRGSGSGIGSPHAPTLIQPQPEEQEREQAQQQQMRRRSGRGGFGRENRSVRESLD